MSRIMKMTAQSIDGMHANEFRKDDFRRLLKGVEALGLELCYEGELAGYESKLILLDASDMDRVEAGYFLTGEEHIKELGSIVELCSGFAQSQGFNLFLLAETTQKFCSIRVRYDSKLIREGTKIKYFRAEQLGEMPEEFKEFYHADAQCFEFCLPFEMGALLTLLLADKHNQWQLDEMPCALRTIAVFRALDELQAAQAANYFALRNREINERFW